jgi:polyisoprenoid-binding protein YceI
MTQATTAEQWKTLLSTGALAGDWKLDPARSTVKLDTKTVWGMLKVKGTFAKVTGQGTITADGQSTGTLTVDAASVDTGNAKRDKHLRSADLLDVEAHPEITFHATKASLEGGGIALSGTLTVHGTAKPVTVTADVAAQGADEITLDASVPVNRADYGVTWNQLGMAGMHNVMTIHAVFVRA